MPSSSIDILWATVVTVSVIFILGALFVFTIFFGQRRYIKAQQALLAQLQDEVAERTQAEQYLRLAEERYRGIFEHAMEGIFQLTTDGHLLSANPALAQIFGYDSPEQLIAGAHQKGNQLIMPDFQEREFRKRLEEEGRLLNFESRSVRKDKKKIWISANIRTVRNSANTTLYYEGSIEDISERKFFETLQRDLSRNIIEAQEAERKRVAFELHDSISQMLSSVRYRLKSAEEKSHGKGRIAWKGAQESRILVEKTIQELRRISRNLRPSTLDDLGLPAAVRTLSEEFAKRTGIALQVRTSQLTQRLPSSLELALFRIIQEALNNVEKHSNATQVEITLTRHNASVFATVTDNGQGFNALKTIRHRSHGLGLISMNERASLLGGTVTVESTRRKGTKISACIPLNNQK